MKYRKTLTAGLCLAALQIASAQVTTWTGLVDTDFNTAGNWDNGLPDNAGNPGIVPTGTVTTLLATSLNGTTVTWSGDSHLNTTAAVRIANSTHTFQGSSNLTTGIALQIGRGTVADVGTLNWDSAGTLSSGVMTVGRDATGTLSQSAGVVAPSSLAIGRGTIVGTYTLSGGNVTTGTFGIVNGTFNFTAGSTGLLTVTNAGSPFDFASLLGTGILKDAADSWIITSNTLAVGVPEPSTYALSLGILALGFVMIRRRVISG
ncbi:PEP-CTERM sorting domain-containing protein [Puniceicoccales bacterium CK1056]|uniref:PEP-CTERM sorting domain-containing protein n=1 Tax=Oceanipulchritudo coccoides TaxID=2706888 RepID=A0A6B2LY02_9BACT|nr:PEP-CTERM sorting domain-containing protein [Oceanipulchritudo coccoides]NDV61481.1 PEP-CTERM sorting domain-containing protein [Oceanipulchritudo coccoides]